MYIKIRKLDAKQGEDDLIINISKKAKIQDLRQMIADELDIEVEVQKLLYKGKQLCDDHELHEYNVQLNDIIQLLINAPTDKETDKVVDSESKESNKSNEASGSTSKILIDMRSDYYKVGDKIDFRDINGAWFEGIIKKIFKNENIDESKNPTKEPDLLFRCLQECLYYPTQLDENFDEIRPRSFYTYEPEELTNGMTVLANYNIDEPKKRGYWYDFKISSTFLKSSIKGTLFVGSSGLPLENVSLKFSDECLRIESPQLLASCQDVELLNSLPLRAVPFHCLNCKDNPERKCKECGCKVCFTKTDIESMLLCDECDDGYHIGCLTPPLTEIPSDDEWYCPKCKTDENEIVKAGEKLKVSNKKLKMPSAKNDKTRDWGSGVACVGRSTICTIVGKNHLGAVPGVDVGTCWRFRFQVSEAGIHRPLVAGIHGKESGAYSIVLSGGYEDDLDNGDEFIYTGSGGRDLSGNKRVSVQSFDQKLLRSNKALAMSCNAKFNATDGAESLDWKKGKPIRVVRNYKGQKHSVYAPKLGNRYDGIYKVVKYYPEKGQSGFIVWKYLFRRDDPNPAPWHDGGKEYEIIYPKGHLEAEAQKRNKREEAAENTKKKKGKKRVLKDATNETVKRQKYEPYELPEDILNQIENDKNNTKVWTDCMDVLSEGRRKFLAKVEELFMCICCQDLIYLPITTECKHNICKSCLDQSFAASIYNCPHCRFELGKDYKLVINDVLAAVLITLFPGYNNSR